MRVYGALVMLALAGLMGCAEPVTGPACVPGGWQGPSFPCLCSDALPTSDQCSSAACERRLILLYRRDGTFLVDEMDIDDSSFSTLFGDPPREGMWEVRGSALWQRYEDPLEAYEKTHDYTCEGDTLLRHNLTFERLSEDFEAAIQRAVATGDWVNQPY